MISKVPGLPLLPALLECASAFVFWPGEAGVEEAFRWDYTVDELYDVGLDGGLTWATEPDFCTKILPRFHESSYNPLVNWLGYHFINCSQINDALTLAFSRWEDNHGSIRFFDVTEECAMEGVGENCSVAEIYITAGDNVTLDFMAAGSTSEPCQVMLGKPGEAMRKGPMLTTGEHKLLEDYVIDWSHMHFQTEPCWYLDSMHCEHIRQLQEHFGVFQLQTIAVGLVVAALVCLLLILVSLGMEARQRGHCLGLRAVVLHVGGSPILVMLWFSMAPLLFIKFALWPCASDCFDFQAAAVHQVGHVLGFAHTDTDANLNLRATMRMQRKICHEPMEWALSSLQVDPLSVMAQLGPHNLHPGACLVKDDLDGLNYLYPLCAGYVLEASCKQLPYNHFWAHIGLLVLAPTCLASLVVLCAVGAIFLQDSYRTSQAMAYEMQRGSGRPNAWRIQSRRVRHSEDFHRIDGPARAHPDQVEMVELGV